MRTIEIPEILSERVLAVSRKFPPCEHPLYLTALRLLSVSDYAYRQMDAIKKLLQEDEGQSHLDIEDYHRFISVIPLESSSVVFAQALREFRHRHLLRLCLQEIAGFTSIEETMTGWSDCADALILHTIRFVERTISVRYGKPHGESGELATLYVLAMGKLGGRELNFSSDIDLIFAFSEAGHTDGPESISNQEYFSKVVQQLISLLQNKTPEGFVFRVDVRLRPNGDSGPLVYTSAAIETYYQEQGRDWERYAMVKARVLGTHDHQAWFKRLITPFIYRRYVDFSVIESLRSMKAMIEREVQLNPMLDDIKRGRGGIREIEFIIQCFQLIRGGRLPQIQKQNAIAAMAALKQEHLLTHTIALKQAYLFLRQLENAIQIQNDQQLHALPDDPIKQAQIMAWMGFTTWEELLAKLHQYQRIVGHVFHGVLGKGSDYQDDKRLLSMQLSNIWQGHVEYNMAINLLTSLHYSNAERCYQMIHAFRHSPRCRRLSQVARMRLDQFMVILLLALTQVPEPDVVLLQVLNLLENIVGRSAYLALLTENPTALQELLHWFSHSPFITDLLVNHPFLLEILIDQKKTWKPPTKRKLKDALQEKLSHAMEPDLEGELLRQFKLTCWLLAARAELYKQFDAMRMGQFLSDVAEVIISEVLSHACHQLQFRHPDIVRVKSRFAIIAYGKLCSREMNYNSDVDLVFLHAVSASDEGLVTRLTQKMLHMLTTRSQTGILYAVDTRLRPSGSSGLLVSHVDAFIDYQKCNAWTWEHQAILRARVLMASQPLRSAFHQLKNDVLHLPREKESVRHDIENMRKKMVIPVGGNPLKYDAGGGIDLEFLVQFLVLIHPHARFIRLTNTLKQLHQLHAQEVLTDEQWFTLKKAYRHYHTALHQHLLQSKDVTCTEYQREVVRISGSFLSGVG
jgi:glutamate-ammonia-ligase adenylyltransferase